MNNSQKKKEKQWLRALSNLAERKNGHIDQYEIGRDFAIGLDRIGRTIFYYKQLAGRETSQSIPLAEVEWCEIQSVSRNLPPDKGGRKIIDRLHLVFTPVHKEEAVVRLEIYNSEENLSLDREVQLAEKWKKLVLELLEIKV